MKNIPVKKEFSYNPIGSYRNGNPYTIAFVYPKDRQPFIVKGGYQDCNQYLNQYNYPAIVHFTFYRHDKHRRMIKFINCNDQFYLFKLDDYYKISLVKLRRYLPILRLRRIPRKWIKELNDYI